MQVVCEVTRVVACERPVLTLEVMRQRPCVMKSMYRLGVRLLARHSRGLVVASVHIRALVLLPTVCTGGRDGPRTVTACAGSVYRV